MIDVKQIARAKGTNGTGGGSSSTTTIVQVAQEAKYAVEAGKAEKATFADQAENANKAVHASRSDYATTAGSLDENSEVYDQFLRKDQDDTANGIITFLKGIKLGSDGKYHIDADGKAALSTIVSDLIESGEIRTEYLTVTKAAHFFKLIVDEMKSTSGTIINTAANCILDKVEAYDAQGNVIEEGDTATEVDHWRCYWKAKDGDGKAITSQWLKYDQAIVWTNNLAEGESYDTSTHYWWRLVEGVSNAPVSTVIDGEAYDCHYIDISNTTYDQGEYTGIESGIPQVGDNVAQLGYRGLNGDGDISDDKSRGSAIIFAAYNTPDVEIVSPSFCQYYGITDFNLPSHRYTWFAMNGNKVAGNFEVSAGAGLTSYTHYAYADSDTYTDGMEWVKGSMNGKKWKYKGVVATTSSDDSELTFADYSWEEIFYSPVYDVSLSQYADNVVVDAEGNVINGLWKELSYTNSKGVAVKDKVYTISSALYVTKNGTPLMETSDDTASEGYYRIAGVAVYGCQYYHVNGGNFAITAIDNCHDGVSSTEEEIDYDAMRLMHKVELKITLEIEGKDEIRIVSMPVVINHSNEAYITTEIDNDMAAATYNTVKKSWIGKNECVAKVSKRHGTDALALTGLNVSGYSGMEISADVSTGIVKITDFTDTTPRTENVKITSTCSYAGISYENEKIWTVVIRNGNANYQLSLNTQFVTFTDGKADIPTIKATAFGIGEGDKITDIDTPSDYGLKIYYSVDGGTKTAGDSVTPTADNSTVTFYLEDTDGNQWDKEDASIIITARSITETVIEYALSDQGTKAPSTGWESSPQTQTTAQPYLWTRTSIKYNYGDPDYSYSVSKMGADGIKGNDGADGWTFVITPEIIEIDDYTDVNNTAAPDCTNAIATVYAYKGTTKVNPSSVTTGDCSYCTATSTSTGIKIASILQKTYTYTASDNTTKSIKMYADSGYVDFSAEFTCDGKTVTHQFRASFKSSIGSKYASQQITIDGITSTVVNLNTRTGKIEGDYSTHEQTASAIKSSVSKLKEGLESKCGIDIGFIEGIDDSGDVKDVGTISVYGDQFCIRQTQNGTKLLYYDTSLQKLVVTGEIVATSGAFGKYGTIKLNSDGSINIGSSGAYITIDSNGKVNFALAGITYTIGDKTQTLEQVMGMWIASNDKSYMTPASNIQMGSYSFADGLVLSSGDLKVVSGNIGIGTTSPSYKLDVVGRVNASSIGDIAINGSSKNSYGVCGSSTNSVGVYATTDNSSAPAIYAEGNILATGGITARSTSDLRLKNILNRGTDYIKKLLALGDVFDYTFNARAKARKHKATDDEEHIGLAWQTVKNVLPTACGKDKDGYGYINYISPDLIALAIGATQQLAKENEALKKENRELKDRLDRLEDMVRLLMRKEGLA